MVFQSRALPLPPTVATGGLSLPLAQLVFLSLRALALGIPAAAHSFLAGTPGWALDLAVSSLCSSAARHSHVLARAVDRELMCVIEEAPCGSITGEERNHNDLNLTWQVLMRARFLTKRRKNDLPTYLYVSTLIKMPLGMAQPCSSSILDLLCQMVVSSPPYEARLFPN